MCSKVTCKICSKPTWSGCGEHIEEALAGIPKSQRCAGHPEADKKSGLFAKIFGNKN
ncbi:MAG: hypothetical protein RLY62_634 [Actinomycetota bacterium]|jgi:hypothetical protein